LDDDFLVMVNAWWEPLEFTIGDCRPGQEWVTEIDTYDPAAAAVAGTAAVAGAGAVARAGAVAGAEGAPRRRTGDRVTVGPRSVLVLRGPRAARTGG
jgi:glycogen operon protein